MKRRSELLEELQRQRIEIDHRRRLILIPYTKDVYDYPAAIELYRNHHFNIQFIIV